jgi:hypothetical protein
VELIRSVTDSASGGKELSAFAARIGCGKGVTGYVYQTVPAALHVGIAGIPQPWLANLREWPRTTAWMEALGVRLAGRCEGTTSASAMPLNPLKSYSHATSPSC